jgi:hypothetical protein
MRASDVANRPRWGGQAGFYEIWFLVVFEPGARRAWWLRYTTFAPATGPPRATLWAAAFDAAAREPAVGVKAILPASGYDRGSDDRFAIRLGDAELTNGTARGAVAAGAHRIAWEFAFTPAATAARRGPWFLEHLPLPTRVAHANSEVACRGWIEVDGLRHQLGAARAVQKHIWGTRRVEELVWLYCPHFAEDASAALEATSARLRRRLAGGVTAPAVAPLWLRTGDVEIVPGGLSSFFRNGLTRSGHARIEFCARDRAHGVTVSAWCDPRTFVGWDYRDPAGWDVHVAQSDLASCAVEVRSRPHPLARWGPSRRLHCMDGAALEFHGPEPLPGVRYLAWDETA